MTQRQSPDTFDDLPLIETPVIDFQDLEHKTGPNTRVSNAGVKIEPTIAEGDELDFSKDDEAMLLAIEEFEKSLREQPTA